MSNKRKIRILIQLFEDEMNSASFFASEIKKSNSLEEFCNLTKNKAKF